MVHADALLSSLVRHVEEHRHGPAQAQKLDRQGQPPDQGGAVDNI